MKYFVYFLISLKNHDLYIGSTVNLMNRVGLHNTGKIRATKAYKPWKLLGFEECGSRSKAVKRERFLKSHQQRDLLKKRFGL